MIAMTNTPDQDDNNRVLKGFLLALGPGLLGLVIALLTNWCDTL